MEPFMPSIKSCIWPNQLAASDGGPDETRYYAEESGLLVETDVDLDLPMGTITMKLLVDDYRDVGGILLPHRIRQVVAVSHAASERER